MTYLEHALIGDETRRLQRGKLAQRVVASNAQSSRSQPMGDWTSGGVVKDDNEGRSLMRLISMVVQYT